MNGSVRPTNSLVSVIIPCYNAVAYIAQAIDSALNSGGISVEVIVVDDGSTDGTWDVLEGFGDRIMRLRQVKGGPYRARNLGAGIAQGEWLAFLDADDDWLPGKLAAQLAIADESAALIYTDRLNFGDLSRTKERQSDSVRLWDGDIFEPLLLGNFITLSSVMIRKTWFDRVGGFSVERLGVQDWDLWLRCSGVGGLCRLCRDPLTRYRIHPGQMTNDLAQRAVDREDVLRRALSSPRGKKVSAGVTRRAYAGLWLLAAENAASAHSALAIRYYARSIVFDPWNIRCYKGIAKCLIRRK